MAATESPRPAPQDFQDDEIDLFELWNQLVEEKLTIFLTTAILVVLGGTFAYLSPKTYEVEASFLPAFEQNVVVLNYPGVVNITPGSVYQQFVENLSSPSLPLDLIKDLSVREIIGSETKPDQQVKILSSLIKVSLPKESKLKLRVGEPLLSNVKVQADSPEHAMILLNTLMTYADEDAKQQIVSNTILTIEESLNINLINYQLESQRVGKELTAEVERLQEADIEARAKILAEMNLIRQVAKENREYQITRLQSDFDLANKLGITKPINPLDFKKAPKAAAMIDVTNNIPSRYWMGTEILGAEIKSLQLRENDDPFVDGLSGLNKQLTALEVNHRINTILSRKNNEPFSEVLRNLNIQKQQLIEAKQKVLNAKFEVARVIQEPIEPSSPIKPNKMLIIAVAGVLGLMLGVFIALIRGAVKRRKEKLVTA